MGRARAVGRAGGDGSARAALRVALTELAGNARSGQPGHPCDVRFGRDVGRVLAEAQRQIDATHVTWALMDESGIPTTAPRRARRWRSPWLRLGLPALVLAILTINVLVSGPLISTDQRIQTTVHTLADSRPGSGCGGQPG